MEETDEIPTPNLPVRPVPHHCRRSWFQKHIWGKWETIREGRITRGTGDHQVTIGSWVEQKRTCVFCGKVEMRTEETK